MNAIICPPMQWNTFYHGLHDAVFNFSSVMESGNRRVEYLISAKQYIIHQSHVFLQFIESADEEDEEWSPDQILLVAGWKTLYLLNYID